MKKNLKMKKILNRLSKELWGKEINIPVYINNKLRTTLGKLIYQEDKNGECKAIRFEFANFLNTENYKEETIYSVYLHELAHWYCLTEKLMFGDNDNDFKRVALKIGAALSGKIYKVGNFYTLICGGCKKKLKKGISETTAINCIKKKSSCCNSEIKIKKIVCIKDNFKANDKLKAVMMKIQH